MGGMGGQGETLSSSSTVTSRARVQESPCSAKPGRSAWGAVPPSQLSLTSVRAASATLSVLTLAAVVLALQR